MKDPKPFQIPPSVPHVVDVREFERDSASVVDVDDSACSVFGRHDVDDRLG